MVEREAESSVLRLVPAGSQAEDEPEYRAFGFPYDHRVSRFEEAFTIIRTLLQEGRIDFDGRYYQARDCELLPRGPRPNGPPLLIGSRGPRMLDITLPHVQSWNVWFSDTDNSPSGVPPLRDLVDDHARAAGRDPADIERTVAVMVRMPRGEGRIDGSGHASTIGALEGPSEVMADELRAYAREGIAHVQLVVDPIDLQAIRELGPVLTALDRD